MNEPGRRGEDPPFSRNEVSGSAQNVVQAGRIDNVYMFSGSPVDAGQIVVGPVPRQPRHFQPRQQVDELARLAEFGKLAVVCAVTGQRGIGKTQLVGSYARQRILDGWLTAWIPAETADAVVTGLSELADALNLRREGDDDATVLARVRNLLQTRRDPALLVFDNVTDAKHVMPYLPATGSTHIVLTSAVRAVEQLGTRVPVDLFSPDTATRFLLSATGIRDENGAHELAAKLGYLPLALAQAAARIARRPRTDDYDTYLRSLGNVSLEKALRARSGDPYPLGAAEAILLAVEAFLTPQAAAERAVLDLLSVLSPGGVSRGLLGTDDALLNTLFEASLVEFAGGAGDEMVVMHRLTQRVLRERANHDLPAVIDHASRLLDSASFSVQEMWQRREQGEELIRHIDALWEHTCAGDGPQSIVEQILTLRRWAVHQLTFAATADRAVHVAEDVHADHVRWYDGSGPEQMASLHDLARVYQRAGRFDGAIGLYEQALISARQIFGDDDPIPLTIAGNLASAYREAGQFDDAITLLEEMLPQVRRVLGDDHEVAWTSSGHLAAVYQRVGRVDDAILLFEQVLTATRRSVGDDHVRTLEAADGLACAYHAAHQLDKAIQVLEPALAAGRRQRADDHPDILRAASNLAGMYAAVGRLDEAIPLYERTLDDQRQTLGEDNLDAFFTAHSLADSYGMAQRLDDAIQLAEQTLAGRRRVLGDNHPDTLDSAARLADFYRDTGRIDEAIRLAARTLAEQRRILGDKDPQTIEIASILAMSYGAAERWDDAISLWERTMSDSRQVLGEDHELTRGLTAAFAACCRSAQRPDLEIPLRGQIFTTDRRVLGDTHPHTIASAANLAVTYYSVGWADRAIPYLERAFVESENQHGSGDPKTLAIAHHLACAYHDVGKRAEAVLLRRRTGIIARRSLGEGNPITQAALDYLRPATDK